MATVSDPFSTSQTSPSTLTGGDWTPVGSARTLSTSGTASIAVVGGATGTLNASVTNAGSGSSASVSYNGTALTPTFDLSNIASITMTKIGASSIPSVTLTITSQSTGSFAITKSFSGSSDTLTWTMLEFTSLNLDPTDVTQLLFTFNQPAAGTGAVTIDSITSTLVCLAPNTKVLMADGKEKNIQDIKRGEEIFVNGKIHKVARLNILQVGEKQALDIVIIEKDALGPNQPNRKLTVTENHPIVFRGARRPAKCLKNLPRITYYTKESGKSSSCDVLDADENGNYFVYDLQFDHDGTFQANGVEVQSRSPYSDITPLPKELYFDESNWKDQVTWDSFDQELELDFTVLTE